MSNDITALAQRNQQLKAFITGFLSDPAHDSLSANSMTAEVFRIALASLESRTVTVKLSDAWKALIDDAERTELQERRKAQDSFMMPDRIKNVDLRSPLEVEDMYRDRMKAICRAGGANFQRVLELENELEAANEELQERRKAAAEPIYQLINDDWYDADRDTYETVVRMGGEGRIVYAAPQPLTDSEREEPQERRKAAAELVEYGYVLVPDDDGLVLPDEYSDYPQGEIYNKVSAIDKVVGVNHFGMDGGGVKYIPLPVFVVNNYADWFCGKCLLPKVGQFKCDCGWSDDKKVGCKDE